MLWLQKQMILETDKLILKVYDKKLVGVNVTAAALVGVAPE